jgi:hypothetical protein
MRFIVIAPLILSFLSCLSERIERSDPNYAEEFNQIMDARLTGFVYGGCGSNHDNQVIAKVLTVIVNALHDVNVKVLLFTCLEVENVLRTRVSPKLFSLTTFGQPRTESNTSDIYIRVQCGRIVYNQDVDLWKGAKLNILFNIASPFIASSLSDTFRSLSSAEYTGPNFDVVFLSHPHDTINYTALWDQYMLPLVGNLSAVILPPDYIPIPTADTGPDKKAATAFKETLRRSIIDGIISSNFRHFVRNNMNKVRRLIVSVAKLPSLSLLSNSTTDFVAAKSKSVIPSTASRMTQKGVTSASGVTGLTGTTATRSTEYAAVIIEPRIDLAFEYCVRNVMHHLGRDWGLIVYHSIDSGNSTYYKGVTGKGTSGGGGTYNVGNEAYVKSVLKDIPNIQYVPLPTAVNSGDSYNSLVKSAPLFWRVLHDTFGLRKVLLFQTDSVMLKQGIQVASHLLRTRDELLFCLF